MYIYGCFWLTSPCKTVGLDGPPLNHWKKYNKAASDEVNIMYKLLEKYVFYPFLSGSVRFGALIEWAQLYKSLKKHKSQVGMWTGIMHTNMDKIVEWF